MRRSFLETAKDDGLKAAITDIFKNYQQDATVFNILDDDTGNILPLEKFFQFSMRRTGELTPTKNITKAFLTYVQTFEKKKSLDSIIPKIDIYTQSLTPRQYTPRGLEIDSSLKKFVNKYINNKKGRRISYDSVIKQGGPLDLMINGMRTFTTLLDLGLNIPVGLASFVGEQSATFAMMGTKAQAKGTARMATKKGRAILKKYQVFTDRSPWENFTAPGKELTERLSEGMFGLFQLSSMLANQQFLLGSLTDTEWKSGELSPERLTELKLDMGRMRVVPGGSSLIGSTSIGKGAKQYKSWAVPIMRTTVADIETVAKNLRSKPTGEALTTREAKELYRIIGLTSTVLIAGTVMVLDKDDKSFIGQIKSKIYREATTLMQGMSPQLWLSVPRIVTFMTQLGQNIESLILLEGYKSKKLRGKMKGPRRLKQQFTPRFFKNVFPEEQNNKKNSPLKATED